MSRFPLIAIALLFVAAQAPAQTQARRWTETKANDWYEHLTWIVGSNFIPSNAINELEMWQTETFDPQEIDKELGWAEGLGMNTMRVFLHDLLWQQDSAGFTKKIDSFLGIASKHHIRPVFVLFDSCWDPYPHLGPQHPPIPGVHNSGWVQSPGTQALVDAAQQPRLRAYVQGVIGAFAADSRVLAWDLWNEPSSYGGPTGDRIDPEAKRKLVLEMLPKVFDWARSSNPSQPLTSGVWEGDWSSAEKLDPITRVQLEQSDVVSFHNYGWPEDFEQRIHWLQSYHRPILCTEFMARPMGSTFDVILPIAKQNHVAAINWGLVAGKTQTYLPWDSWQRPYVLQMPPVWFHEIFYADGRAYRERETQIIRQLTGASAH